MDLSLVSINHVNNHVKLELEVPKLSRTSSERERETGEVSRDLLEEKKSGRYTEYLCDVANSAYLSMHLANTR